MQYTIKLAAISGEIVPLVFVAEAMARRDATAGDTHFHKPTYDGRLRVYIRALLEDVRSGRLEVCNDIGSPIAVDYNVEAPFGYASRYVKEPNWKTLRNKTPPIDIDWKILQRDWDNLPKSSQYQPPDWQRLRDRWDQLCDALPNTPNWVKLCKVWKQILLSVSPLEPLPYHATWSFSHIDLGPLEPDKNSPNLLWSSTLHQLNQWGSKRGYSFIISTDGVGWIDERGYVVPAKQQDATKAGDKIPHKTVQRIKKKDKIPVPDIGEIDPDKLYGTNRVAYFLGVSQKHVQNILIPEEKLKAKKNPHHWKVKGQDLLRYLEKN